MSASVKRPACAVCGGADNEHAEGCTNPAAPNFCKRCEQVAQHCDAGHCLNCNTDAEGWPYYTDCLDCNVATGLTKVYKAA